MQKLDSVKKHLRQGQVYRRADFMQWSRAVDRHLKELTDDGTLIKVSGGLYLCPKQTIFGSAPADDTLLVRTFLKDDRFLLTSPNHYNALGVGTTQLYNESVVYNHKRHGRLRLNGRVFHFRIKPHFPKSLSTEFLLVDLVNNVKNLAEDTNQVLEKVKRKALSLDKGSLSRFVRHYGGVRTKKFFAEVFN